MTNIFENCVTFRYDREDQFFSIHHIYLFARKNRRNTTTFLFFSSLEIPTNIISSNCPGCSSSINNNKTQKQFSGTLPSKTFSSYENHN